MQTFVKLYDPNFENQFEPFEFEDLIGCEELKQKLQLLTDINGNNFIKGDDVMGVTNVDYESHQVRTDEKIILTPPETSLEEFSNLALFQYQEKEENANTGNTVKDMYTYEMYDYAARVVENQFIFTLDYILLKIYDSLDLLIDSQQNVDINDLISEIIDYILDYPWNDYIIYELEYSFQNATAKNMNVSKIILIGKKIGVILKEAKKK
ncbi:hypothetical protein COEREDRAFT_87492 [Coemansia reversa NRRL 1564]|uniref:Uncharacterized protein n=1 Tax=Coemansia reversa (strain ATCC 12441 / NRRL 1564) TaxID=763665 RepID=A0A2G5B9S8_COERN|nr:hypothetical protein COEREDRAFT_87492 [Coemansia reversa NRRL 1564]|eukprot:PIA15740.1 hypothetical protein COEREDRAFT_87492 [Coemansia reversa NRRL 1564]